MRLQVIYPPIEIGLPIASCPHRFRSFSSEKEEPRICAIGVSRIWAWTKSRKCVQCLPAVRFCLWLLCPKVTYIPMCNVMYSCMMCLTVITKHKPISEDCSIDRHALRVTTKHLVSFPPRKLMKIVLLFAGFISLEKAIVDDCVWSDCASMDDWSQRLLHVMGELLIIHSLG